MTMTDEVLKELWATKDNIGKEHGYNIDELAEYFIQKQSSHHSRFHRDEQDLKAEQGTPADARTSRG
jgi:hypothetical protein